MKMLILLFLLLSVSGAEISCIKKLHYARVCKLYKFEGDCQPYQLEKCKPVKYTHADHFCPHYYCVSIFEQIFHCQIINFSIRYKFEHCDNDGSSDWNRHSFKRDMKTHFVILCTIIWVIML